jgi:hypothetical protein
MLWLRLGSNDKNAKGTSFIAETASGEALKNDATVATDATVSPLIPSVEGPVPLYPQHVGSGNTGISGNILLAFYARPHRQN